MITLVDQILFVSASNLMFITQILSLSCASNKKWIVIDLLNSLEFTLSEKEILTKKTAMIHFSLQSFIV